MKIQVKHSLKTDVGSAFKLCTEQKSQEAVYAKLPGIDVKIKREGRAPNVKLRISRKMPANPPAAIKRLVPCDQRGLAHRGLGGGRRRLCGRHRRRDQGRAGQDRRHQDPAAGKRRQLGRSGTFDITSGIPLLGGRDRVVRRRRAQEEPRGRVQGAEGLGLARRRRVCCSAASHKRNAARARRALRLRHGTDVPDGPGVLPARDRAAADERGRVARAARPQGRAGASVGRTGATDAALPGRPAVQPAPGREHACGLAHPGGRRWHRPRRAAVPP